jgi:2-oxoglutarate dehydrogenase E2 component (dihydrolipoamide succinyltransferase)
LLLLLTVQLASIIKGEGDTVLSNEVIAQFEEGAVSGAAQTEAVQSEAKVEQAVVQTEAGAAPVVERAQVADQAPAVRKALTESGIPAADVAGTGRGGRITKKMWQITKLNQQLQLQHH